MFIQFVFSFVFLMFSVHNEPNSDQILGRWISAEKNLIVEITRNNSNYSAKIVWFDDSDDKTKPVYQRTDWKNPNKTL